MKVVDGRPIFGNVSLDEYRRGPMSDRARRRLVTIPPLDRVDQTEPLRARVYRGLWIADCPDCGAAGMVWVETPVFMCQVCWNGRIGGLWRGVEFPVERGEIEDILEARLLPQEQNWTSETLDELRAENVQHGRPVSARSAEYWAERWEHGAVARELVPMEPAPAEEFPADQLPGDEFQTPGV